MGRVEQWGIYTVLEKLYVPVVCCFTDRHFACAEDTVQWTCAVQLRVIKVCHSV
jgi:hypothetical protein